MQSVTNAGNDLKATKRSATLSLHPRLPLNKAFYITPALLAGLRYSVLYACNNSVQPARIGCFWPPLYPFPSIIHGLNGSKAPQAASRMAVTSPLSPNSNVTYKFPPFQPDHLPTHEEEPYGQSSSRSPSPNLTPKSNGIAPSDRWQPRKDGKSGWANGSAQAPASRHGRQKSLSEAFRTIRTRRASVSANAHEIADALRAPISPSIIVCRKELPSDIRDDC